MIFSPWIRRRFGRKKGLLRSLGSWVKAAGGHYRREANIPWDEVQRLVFVCHGNVCRSPYGELVAREMGWETASCGLFATPAHPAETAALAGAARRGRSLDSHRATHFDEFPWRADDLAVCFEEGHVLEVRARLQARGLSLPVTLLGLFTTPRRPHIEDPFGLPDEYFDTCYELIEEGLRRIGGGFPILVTDAQTIAALACVRSLGQSGYRVHLIGEEGPTPLAFRSRYSRHRDVCPRYDDPNFPAWIEQYLREKKIRLVLPTERFLHALGDRLPSVLPFLHAPVPIETLRRSLSKYDLFESFHGTNDPRLLENLPPHLLVDLKSGDVPSPAALSALGTPIFLKIDRSRRQDDGGSEVQRVNTSTEALTALEALRGRVDKVLMQGFVHGRGVGVFLLRWQGRVRADFGHLRLHEVPHTGGYSSLRRTHRDARLLADAELRAEALGWEGPAMFEYRQDAETGDFRLMELNPRFWGSLHLALYAGVDFPVMLARLAQGLPTPSVRGAGRDVTARLLVPGEVQYLRSRLKDPRLSLIEKLKSVGEFFALFADSTVRDDLNYPGDRTVFLYGVANYMRLLGIALLRRLRNADRRVP